jgi:hypothetical protein
MESIVKVIDGTYIDLSRVVAITPVERVATDYRVTWGFNVVFLPDGIPFKQDGVFSVVITKRYRYPLGLSGNPSGYHSTQFQEFLDESKADMEEERTKLAEIWMQWKEASSD